MRSSANASTNQNGHRPTGTTTVNNANTGNSGSQYALCALGVGLVALGIVMIVWSVVPADPSANNSVSSGGDPDRTEKKQKASSVAFVLVGSGVAVLLLSMCLGMRNKQREQQFLQQQQQQQSQATAQSDAETAEEQARRYAVPSYEEAVGSGQYPVTQSNLRPSVSQLPSYDDLVTVDGLQYESEGAHAAATTTICTTVTTTAEQPASSNNNNRRLGKNKLLPIKIRRIKSEKLRMKEADVPQAPTQISIEPLTPPPQYEDKVPPL